MVEMDQRGPLEWSSADLEQGDYTCGFVQPSTGDPHVLAGGYRIEVEDCQPGQFVMVEIKEAVEKRFGPNRAKGEILPPGSRIELSSKTGTGIRYRLRDGNWVPLDRGVVEHKILSQIARLSPSNIYTDVTLPGFDPRAALPVTVELLLKTDPGEDVLLYSPGSRSHWGNKGEIRQEYARYGLSPATGVVEDASRLSSLFPEASGSDNPRSGDGGHSKSRLYIAKKPGDVFEASTPEYLVVNFISRTREEYQKFLKDVREQFPKSQTIVLWSPFTKRERPGTPILSPPGEHLRDRITLPQKTIEEVESDECGQQSFPTSETLPDYTTSDDGEFDLPTPPTTTDLRGFLSGTELEVRVVGSDELDRRFREIYSESRDIRDQGHGRAAGLILNAHMALERLPVPASYYDEWITQRKIDGEVYLPKTSEERIDEVSEHDPEGEFSMLHAVKTLEGIRESLLEENPMFEELANHIKKTVPKGHETAVFTPSKTVGKILLEAFQERGDIDESLIDESVEIVDPDSSRDIGYHDYLIITGPQRPGYACFYTHPRAGEKLVLTHSKWPTGMINRHADEYGQTLNEAISPELDLIPGVVGGNETNSDGVQEKKSRNSEQSGAIPSSLEERDLDRLLDLIELSPTKNAELADRWGYESGSDVYQYLSSTLREYYSRNEDSLIVPTEEGEELAKNWDSS